MVELSEGGARITPMFPRQSIATMSYFTARDTETSKTFYEGELSLKTGTLSKTKMFGVLLKGDSTFYVIDSKLLPKVDGQFSDRIDPYSREIGVSRGSVSS